MEGPFVALCGQGEAIPIAVFSDLGKQEGTHRQLSRWLYVDRLQKNRPVRKGIPALSIFLDLFVAWNPVEAAGRARRKKSGELKNKDNGKNLIHYYSYRDCCQCIAGRYLYCQVTY